jgi:hypothetical protein
MKIERKIQLSAGAVLLSGIAAITMLAPRSAQANPCAQIVVCDTSCPSNLDAACQSVAPSGCTVTSATCIPDSPLSACFHVAAIICNFQ